MPSIIIVCIVLFFVCFCIYSFVKYMNELILKLVTKTIFDVYNGSTYQKICILPYSIYVWKTQNTEVYHITVTIKDTEALVASWNYNRKNDSIQIIGIIDPYFKNFLEFISKK